MLSKVSFYFSLFSLWFRDYINTSDHKFFQGIDGYSQSTIPKEEQRSFAQWINNQFKNDQDVSHHLPFNSEGSDMYDKLGDGILLW